MIACGLKYFPLPNALLTQLSLNLIINNKNCYNFTGETTVSNEVLDTVLKAGEVLKIRGLWRQTEESNADSTAEKSTPAQTTATVNKQLAPKKPEEIQPKIALKKDDKLLKTFTPVNAQGVTR